MRAIDSAADPIALAEARFQALYRHHGTRIVATNEIAARPAPRFHLQRTQHGPVARFRSDLSQETCEALSRAIARERPRTWSSPLPELDSLYRAILAEPSRAGEPWAGPAYTVPDSTVFANDAKQLTSADAALLMTGLEEWIPDLEHSRPVVVALDRGVAASICASVRRSAHVHEAGVETVPGSRRQGLARRAVARWAELVRSVESATPIYSTSWSNAASLGVARSLACSLFCVDYWIG